MQCARRESRAGRASMPFAFASPHLLRDAFQFLLIVILDATGSIAHSVHSAYPTLHGSIASTEALSGSLVRERRFRSSRNLPPPAPPCPWKFPLRPPPGITLLTLELDVLESILFSLARDEGTIA